MRTSRQFSLDLSAKRQKVTDGARDIREGRGPTAECLYKIATRQEEIEEPEDRESEIMGDLQLNWLHKTTSFSIGMAYLNSEHLHS